MHPQDRHSPRRLSVVLRRLTKLFVLALTLFVGTPAYADVDPDELARRHFEAGAAYFEQEEYEAALREFGKAYELSGRAEILISIATAHERMGALDRAVESLDAFLRARPESEDYETVKARRDALERRAREQAPKSSTDERAAEPTAPNPAVETAAPHGLEEEPSADRVPAYILLSVAGVTLAGSVLTGVLAKAEYDNAKQECGRACGNDQVATGRAMATTSTVLTGVALLSAAVGAVFWFSADPAEDEADASRTSLTLAPARGLSGGFDGVEAFARWSF
jgi:tetratricopeptide (TPR) repeat protein